jgi:hypothetical protein
MPRKTAAQKLAGTDNARRGQGKTGPRRSCLHPPAAMV